MAGDVARIERKLAQIVAEKHCETCANRTEICPSCGRPVGPLPGAGDDARHRLVTEIERLAERRERLQDQIAEVE